MLSIISLLCDPVTFESAFSKTLVIIARMYLSSPIFKHKKASIVYKRQDLWMRNVLLHAQLIQQVNPWFAISCRPAKTVRTKNKKKVMIPN